MGGNTNLTQDRLIDTKVLTVPDIGYDTGKASLFFNIERRAKKLFLKWDSGQWFASLPAVDRTTGYLAKHIGNSVFIVGLWVNDTYGVPQSKVCLLTKNDFHHYTVDLLNNTCTCPCFADHHHCKHLLGLHWWLANHKHHITPKGYLTWENV